MEEAATPTPAATDPPLPYADRLKAILERPGLIDEVFANVANGGDLITLCGAWDIRYSDLADWIRKDQARAMVYADANRLAMEWGRQRVLNELRAIGLADLRLAFTETGQLKDPKDWPESIARALAGVETDELFEGSGATRTKVGHTRKVKLNGKTEALKLIGQEFGLFVQRHKVEANVRLEDLVAGSFDEAPK